MHCCSSPAWLLQLMCFGVFFPWVLSFLVLGSSHVLHCLQPAFGVVHKTNTFYFERLFACRRHWLARFTTTLKAASAPVFTQCNDVYMMLDIIWHPFECFLKLKMWVFSNSLFLQECSCLFKCTNGAVCVSAWLKVLEGLLEGCSSFPLGAGRSSPWPSSRQEWFLT